MSIHSIGKILGWEIDKVSFGFIRKWMLGLLEFRFIDDQHRATCAKIGNDTIKELFQLDVNLEDLLSKVTVRSFWLKKLRSFPLKPEFRQTDKDHIRTVIDKWCDADIADEDRVQIALFLKRLIIKSTIGLPFGFNFKVECEKALADKVKPSVINTEMETDATEISELSEINDRNIETDESDDEQIEDIENQNETENKGESEYQNSLKNTLKNLGIPRFFKGTPEEAAIHLNKFINWKEEFAHEICGTTDEKFNSHNRILIVRIEKDIRNILKGVPSKEKKKKKNKRSHPHDSEEDAPRKERRYSISEGVDEKLLSKIQKAPSQKTFMKVQKDGSFTCSNCFAQIKSVRRAHDHLIQKHKVTIAVARCGDKECMKIQNNDIRIESVHLERALHYNIPMDRTRSKSLRRFWPDEMKNYEIWQGLQRLTSSHE